MGNSSVNTACNPRFFRLDAGISACKNSLYELVCNSMRFGGAMISLILPKLIRSIARDGIWTFTHWPATVPSRLLLLNDKKQVRRVQQEPRTCCNSNRHRRFCFFFFFLFNL